ncbi:MAG: hypothetical protein CME71_00240 [Halobacteriovorax sp.]|nr:hypothetical protein [Halobacteriovorax sp.]
MTIDNIQQEGHGLPVDLSPLTPEELENISRDTGADEEENGKKPQYLVAIDILKDKVRPFLTPDDEVYVDYQNSNHTETIPVYSSQFNRLLNSLYYKEQGGVLNKESRSKIKDYFSAMAYDSGEVHEVGIRVMYQKGIIYYDLANEQREIVKISPESWEIIQNPPVRFIRKKGMLSNVRPDPLGDINILKKYLNLPNEEQWYLVSAFILQSLYSSPYPILVMNGEQGTGKTTNSKVICLTIDPSSVLLNSRPRDERDIFIAASNSLLLSFDNLSGISSHTADTFCRLSTGSGVRLRKLHTDDEEKFFYSARPILINGIDDLATRGDLISRSLLITPPVISNEDRITEKEFWSAFEEDRARILGGVFNALVIALRNLPTISLDEKPRMADFAQFSCAASEALGISQQSFINAYRSNINETNRNSIDLDPVALAIINLVHTKSLLNEDWFGTMSELADELLRFLPANLIGSKYIPQTPQAMSNKLKRITPMLLSVKVGVEKLDRQEDKRPYRLFKISDDHDNPDNELPF